MSKFIKVCLSSRVTLVALVVGGLIAVGLLAWGIAPQLVLTALPVLGVIACLLPCLLPLYWLRRTSTTTPAAGVTGPRPADIATSSAPVAEQP